jgi:hypothetical protein
MVGQWDKTHVACIYSVRGQFGVLFNLIHYIFLPLWLLCLSLNTIFMFVYLLSKNPFRLGYSEYDHYWRPTAYLSDEERQSIFFVHKDSHRFPVKIDKWYPYLFIWDKVPTMVEIAIFWFQIHITNGLNFMHRCRMNFMKVHAFLLKGWLSSLNTLSELVSNRKSSSPSSSARVSVTSTCYPRFKNMKWFW